MITKTLDFTSPYLTLKFEQHDDCLNLSVLSAQGVSWLDSRHPSPLFALVLGDGRTLSALNLPVSEIRDLTTDGARHLLFIFDGPEVRIDQHIKIYDDTAMLESWLEVTGKGSAPIEIQRIDSLSLNIRISDPELFYFTGNWGSEFEPHRQMLTSESVILETRSGRSSKGHHPWFALSGAHRPILSGAVAWSGNWVLRFESEPDGACRLSGGLHDWSFSKHLAAGKSMTSPPLILVMGQDLNAVSMQYASVGRRFWYPQNPLSSLLPVEWNHWWPYEDAEINEAVFRANVDKAQEMGFEVCTLDAGWFGPSDEGTFWEHYRGDWDRVNTQRFPSGITALARYTHDHGMKFGIWCEIEGLGEAAQVARDHPEYVAERDGERLGGLCFGNPAVQEWAFQTLSHLIEDYDADWIKVDFNLDFQAGCNRTDHGHQAGDGLYEHVMGYYRVMTRIRQAYPDVILENCSSGGLRIDLGSLRQTHFVFLSDPDWPVHDLQIFWGASTMLAPDKLLHWPFSEWRNLNPPPYQTFDPWDPELTVEKWDYYARISMLGVFGLSQKLPDLPPWMEARIIEQIKLYKTHIRPFIKKADLYRLTAQPHRSGEGERWAAFQYRMPDGSENLLFVFRLPGAEMDRTIRLMDLEHDREYTLSGFEGKKPFRMLGSALMKEGLRFSDLAEEASVLLKIS